MVEEVLKCYPAGVEGVEDIVEGEVIAEVVEETRGEVDTEIRNQNNDMIQRVLGI